MHCWGACLWERLCAHTKRAIASAGAAVLEPGWQSCSTLASLIIPRTPVPSPPHLVFPSPNSTAMLEPQNLQPQPLCLLRAAPGAQRRNESVNQSVSRTATAGGNCVCLPKRAPFLATKHQWCPPKRGSTAHPQDLMWEVGWKYLRCHQDATTPTAPIQVLEDPSLPSFITVATLEEQPGDPAWTTTKHASKKPPLGSPLAKHIV